MQLIGCEAIQTGNTGTSIAASSDIINASIESDTRMAHVRVSRWLVLFSTVSDFELMSDLGGHN